MEKFTSFFKTRQSAPQEIMKYILTVPIIHFLDFLIALQLVFDSRYQNPKLLNFLHRRHLLVIKAAGLNDVFNKLQKLPNLNDDFVILMIQL